MCTDIAPGPGIAILRYMRSAQLLLRKPSLSLALEVAPKYAMEQDETGTEEGLVVRPRDSLAGRWSVMSGGPSIGTPSCSFSSPRAADNDVRQGVIGLDGLDSCPPAEEVHGPSGWVYHSTSLFCLKPYQFPRNVAIRAVEQRYFEGFIALTIAANCVTMAWESPLDPCCTWKAGFIDVRPNPMHWPAMERH